MFVWIQQTKNKNKNTFSNIIKLTIECLCICEPLFERNMQIFKSESILRIISCKNTLILCIVCYKKSHKVILKYVEFLVWSRIFAKHFSSDYELPLSWEKAENVLHWLTFLLKRCLWRNWSTIVEWIVLPIYIFIDPSSIIIWIIFPAILVDNSWEV